MNVSIEVGLFPDQWKSAYVIILPNCRSPSELKDANMHFTITFKSFEKMLYSQIKCHFKSQSLTFYSIGI